MLRYKAFKTLTQRTDILPHLLWLCLVLAFSLVLPAAFALSHHTAESSKGIEQLLSTIRDLFPFSNEAPFTASEILLNCTIVKCCIQWFFHTTAREMKYRQIITYAVGPVQSTCIASIEKVSMIQP